MRFAKILGGVLAGISTMLACGGRVEDVGRPSSSSTSNGGGSGSGFSDDGQPAPSPPSPFTPPPSGADASSPTFPIGDGGVATCDNGDEACTSCGEDCSALMAAQMRIGKVASVCAMTSGAGGGCSSIRVDVGSGGCAAAFTVVRGGQGSNAAFVSCVEDALAALRFTCAEGQSITTGFEAGPCGGP